MSAKKSQSHKSKEQNNRECLNEFINKIESMKNKISNTYQLITSSVLYYAIKYLKCDFH